MRFPKKDMKCQAKQEPVRNEKTERQLLGELYVDKAFLEKLLKDEGFQLLHLVNAGLGSLRTASPIRL